MKKVLVGALVLAAMAPSSNASASWGPFSICAPGAVSPSYYACASASVAFVSGTQQIVLTLQNVGLYHNNALVTDWGYGITGIGITAPPIANASLYSVTGSQAVGTNPGAEWAFSNKINGLDVQAGAQINGVDDGAIWGCNGTPGGNSYFKTCNGADAVVFTFNTAETQWAPGSFGIYFAMRGQSGYQGDSYRCSDDPAATNGVDCQGGGGGPDSSVPEPVSLVLLGSGLLGLAGVRNWRRRNR